MNNDLIWKNKVNLFFSKLPVLFKLYVNLSLLSIIFDLVGIILFLKNGSMVWAIAFFILLFLSIYQYIQSIDFKIEYVELSGEIVAINFENFLIHIEVGDKIAVCLVTDIFCRRAIKQPSIRFTGGSHLSGTAYGLFRRCDDTVSFFRIFHVDKIKVIS